MLELSEQPASMLDVMTENYISSGMNLLLQTCVGASERAVCWLLPCVLQPLQSAPTCTHHNTNDDEKGIMVLVQKKFADVRHSILLPSMFLLHTYLECN